MRIGLAGDSASAAWTVFSETGSIDIASGGEGEKTIFVQYKDFAENVSPWYSDTTIYDASLPSGAIAIVDENGFTNDADPLCAVTGNEADR